MLRVFASRISFVGNHSSDFRRAEGAAIQNRLRILVRVTTRRSLDSAGQEEVTVLVCKSGRGKEMTERNPFARRVRLRSRFPREAHARPPLESPSRSSIAESSICPAGTSQMSARIGIRSCRISTSFPSAVSGGDHDRRLPMHHRPAPNFGSARSSHLFRRHREMLVLEMRLRWRQPPIHRIRAASY